MSQTKVVELPQNAQVLMVRMSALGDIVFALETLASLKAERPDVQVDFLVEDCFVGLLEGHPQIAGLVVFPRRSKWSIARQLWRMRRKKYDILLDLHGNAKSSLQVFFCRARVKVGYDRPVAREGAHRFYHHRVKIPEPLPHRADRGLLLLRALGLSGEPQSPVIPFKENVPDFWNGRDKKRIVLHPGTSDFAAFKRWPLDAYVELATRLTVRGLAVGLSHGPGEEWMADRILQAVPDVIPVGRGLGLLGLATALRDVDVLVAADTGPLHIAAAVGTRVVALLGPKEPRHYSPRGEGHAVLYHDVPCRPCLRRACPSAQCVLGVSVAEVEAAVLDAVAQTV